MIEVFRAPQDRSAQVHQIADLLPAMLVGRKVVEATQVPILLADQKDQKLLDQPVLRQELRSQQEAVRLHLLHKEAKLQVVDLKG